MNDYRISHGRPSLGFLNPFLYSKGVAGLVDIVVRVPTIGVRGLNLVVDKIYRVERTLAVVLKDSPRLPVGIR